MKKLIYKTTILFLIIFIPYLFVSFILWNINIGDWSIYSRLLFIFIAFFVLIIIAAIHNELEKDRVSLVGGLDPSNGFKEKIIIDNKERPQYNVVTNHKGFNVVTNGKGFNVIKNSEGLTITYKDI